MRITISTIIAITVCFVSAKAQDKTTLVQRMNEIMKQTEVYFYDKATFLNADTAKYVATQRLLLDINANYSENDKISVEEIMPYASYINIDRGEKKQCFVYIKKADALALRRGEPVAPVVMNTPAPRTPIIRVPTNTNPVATPSPSPVQRSFIPDAFVQRIMETKDFKLVYNYLKSQKTDGAILQFGSLKEVQDYSSLDLILFDMHSQQVVTLLSAETDTGNRINMVNGTEDSLSNYPTNMTAVIWYIKK